jgi:hypothetical protein
MNNYDSVENETLLPSKNHSSRRAIGHYDSKVPSIDGIFRNVFRRSDILSKLKKRRITRRQRINQDFHHSWIYTMLNSKSRTIQAVVFKNIMSVVILIDLTFFVISTEPRFRDHKIFYIEEGVASLIFMCEYVARIITIVEHKKYGPIGPFKGRIMYMLTFHSLIDALATFPFFLEFVIQLKLPHLTYLRFFRLMRILRTEPLGKAMDSLQRVLFYNREILYVAVVMAAGLIMFTAVLMYYLRPQEMDDEENEWSISTTIYYSTLMLTGQGGPDGKLPWYTQVVVLMTGLFSIGMFAIPASMLTWGFEAEAQRVASKTRRRYLQKISGGFNLSSPSSSSSSEDNGSHSASSSDEEYFKLIAGEGDDHDKGDSLMQKEAEESLRKLRELILMFQNADSDGSGSLSKDEFLRMVYPILPNGKDDMQPSVSDEIGRTSSLTLLSTKVNTLEIRLEETNSKLDQILNLLEKIDHRHE